MSANRHITCHIEPRANVPSPLPGETRQQAGFPGECEAELHASVGKHTFTLSESVCAALTRITHAPDKPIRTRLRGRASPPVDAPSHYWSFSTYSFLGICEFTQERCICRFAELYYFMLENES